ncbi:hypothetical protein DWY99_12770 [[Clostridium] leptum]|uniref:Uncharacterized protein n=1 Tax=[Clostridium] leptum TaxID=1535 RepID=A0A412AUQ5_9FIRM|nr:hypothetical protein DWY99_12770 [[Clostridium] leptum]
MTGAGLRQNTAVYSAAPKATPACVIPRFSSSGAFIFCPFFLVHCTVSRGVFLMRAKPYVTSHA